MFLIAEPTTGFIKFIQILCWIIVPVLLSTVLMTVLLHYRRKKKEAARDNDTDYKFMQASTEQVGYTNGDGEYVLFDHSQLIREYKNSLTYNHARFTALQNDFAVMETKYVALARYTRTRFSTPQNKTMENSQEQMPQHIEAEVNKLAQDHKAEKKELLTRLEQLNKSYQSLEQENRSLQEQVSMVTATDEERNNIIQRWKEENTSLWDKVAEQEYLNDILEEKKVQINFLQGQVEQRVKSQHQAEHQRLQVLAEIEDMKKESHDTTKHAESLKNELLLKQDHADKLQVVLCEKEEQLTEKQQALNAKNNHIIYLENVFNETKAQNELLNAELADNKDLVNVLRQQLVDEQSRVQSMESKLQAQKQLMRRLYKEFSACMEDDCERSPVIALRPEYGNKENEVMVIQ